MNQFMISRREEYPQEKNCVHNKILKFRNEIRRTEVENQRRQLREQLIESLSPSYPVLKNIQINQVLNELLDLRDCDIKQEAPRIEIISNDLIAYTHQQNHNKHHLFELIEIRHIQKLIGLISWANLPNYKESPRTYIKILTILTIYTSECQEISLRYMDLLIDILGHLKSLKQWHQNREKFFYFTQPQFKQIVKLVFVSFTNIGFKRQEFFQAFLKPEGVMETALEEGSKIKKYLQKHQISDNNKETQILTIVIELFQELLSFLSEQDQQLMQKVYKLDFQVIDFLLQLMKSKQLNNKIQLAINGSLKTFLYTHLSIKPAIIIKHNLDPFFIKLQEVASLYFSLHIKIANYDKALQIEGEKNLSIFQLKKEVQIAQERLVLMLQVVQLIYGVNIPDDSKEEQKFYDCLQRWFQLYVLPIFVEAFSFNQSCFDKIITIIINILENVCLEEVLLQEVLNETIIMKKLLYYASSNQSSFKLRKNALICLSNIMLVTLEGQSDNAQEVIDLIQQNKIIETFATYLGAFVDQNLNLAMLKALQLLFLKDSCQTNEENRYWIQFAEEGGRMKLEKMINFSKPSTSEEQKEINFMAESILNQYEGNDI